MLVGILIGLVLTALTVLLSAVIWKKNFGPLSYVVIAVALIFFCIKGISIVTDINVRMSIDTLETLLQTTTKESLALNGENHKLSIAEATGVLAGLRLAYPQMAKYVKPSDLIGHSLGESVTLIGQKAQHDTTRHLWATIIGVIIVMGLAVVIIAILPNAYNAQHRQNHVHRRAPRNSHRGRR